MIGIILSIFIFPLLSMAQNIQVVDIGFRDYDKHIVIELTTSNGEDAVRFGLASNTSGKSVAVSKCSYTQASLEAQLTNITDPKVRADFNWIFLRSNYSATAIDQFYPELKALLERANPECSVQDFEQIKDQLDQRNG